MLASKVTTLLQRCATVKHTQQIHVQLLINGISEFEPGLFHQVLLCSFNSSGSSSHYAQQVFDHLPDPDVYSWSSTIRYFTQNGRFRDALSVYIQMIRIGLVPSIFVVSAALKSCARVLEKFVGMVIHSQVHKYGYDADVYVQTSLVDFYSKLGDIEIARRVFDEMPKRNVVSWNSILYGYFKNGKLRDAQSVFDEMPMKYVVSWNSMISGYAKARDMGKASSLFEQMLERNLASWNSNSNSVYGISSHWSHIKKQNHGMKFFSFR